MFADDNLIGNLSYAKELFEKIKPLNKVWGGQISISIAQNEELLKLAAQSGCKSIFIGFETLNNKNLESINKHRVNKIEEYSELINRIKSYGIQIFGSFIVGLDHDNESIFESIYEFVAKNDIEYPVVGNLTPFPGTLLFEQLESENRIIDYNWDRYNLTQVVFTPRNMTADTLQFEYDNLLYHLGKLKR